MIWRTKDATGWLALSFFPFSLASGIKELSLQVNPTPMSKGSKAYSLVHIFIRKWLQYSVFCHNPFFSFCSESKSPLCGTEKNTLHLNNGLKMHLIYKWEDWGRGTDSEILQHEIKEEEMTRHLCLLWFEGHCEENNAVKESSSY